jgi:hypothetical protein
LLNRRYCQHSGSMSAAQVCGGENDADSDCRQSQSQLDRVSFAHPSKLLLLDALAFEVAAGDRRFIFFTPRIWAPASPQIQASEITQTTRRRRSRFG